MKITASAFEMSYCIVCSYRARTYYAPLVKSWPKAFDALMIITRKEFNFWKENIRMKTITTLMLHWKIIEWQQIEIEADKERVTLNRNIHRIKKISINLNKNLSKEHTDRRTRANTIHMHIHLHTLTVQHVGWIVYQVFPIISNRVSKHPFGGDHQKKYCNSLKPNIIHDWQPSVNRGAYSELLKATLDIFDTM